MEITFWGVRGGIPVSGKDFSEFGGDTPCVQISLEDKEIIIDSGTGIR
ncbi:MAG TPA: MBL fold metallo-hydrolase, partial [Desulfonauticus sp.]|nr:MBL fold metallo-hydrolase [Desulfonauticus sp.]